MGSSGDESLEAFSRGGRKGPVDASPGEVRTIASSDANPLRDRSFGRILLVKPSSLGDIVHALPVLHGLRLRFPDAHLAWLVATAFAPLLRGHPEVDEVIEFDRRRFGRVGQSITASRSFLEFVRELRGRRFDLAIDLQGLFRSGFLALASGAPVRIGFTPARELAGMFYTHRIPAGNPELHAVDRNYRVAPLLGFADVLPTMDLAVTAAEREEAWELLVAAGLPADESFVAVLPGARGETKQWPIESFASLVAMIQNDLGLRVVLLGGPDERERCAEIRAACAGALLDLGGRTTLRQLVAVLEKAAVVVCHDSGPLHLAVALDRPLVCLIGPTNPRRTGPYRRPEAVVRLDLPCSPCYLRRLEDCRRDHACLKGLPAAQVIERVRLALEHNAPRIDV